MSMAVSAPSLPSVDADLDELAEWWVAHGSALNSRLYEIRRRVETYVRDRTTVDTPSGRLEAQSNGWEWKADDIAAEFPDLVSESVVEFKGTRDQIERVLSLVTEDVPGVDFEVSRTIDTRRAGKYANAGGEMGERLRELRSPKPAKVVIR